MTATAPHGHRIIPTPPPALLTACQQVDPDVCPATVEALWSRITFGMHGGGDSTVYLVGAAKAMLTQRPFQGGPDVRGALTALAMADPAVQKVLAGEKEKVA